MAVRYFQASGECSTIYDQLFEEIKDGRMLSLPVGHRLYNILNKQRRQRLNGSERRLNSWTEIAVMNAQEHPEGFWE